ncbi:hypothetical protein CALCODRAFT_479773 [Calocera cornea HHB12733]|uniref:Uncharacterized protein n=1 Tax=Calocera cornea HHB12733 TaxID=1353952 RepID=A0A165JF06_9BASI|nr:hypothetical protein CALCODRAFT_479773 [Calocera cornea HHB12733]
MEWEKRTVEDLRREQMHAIMGSDWLDLTDVEDRARVLGKLVDITIGLQAARVGNCGEVPIEIWLLSVVYGSGDLPVDVYFVSIITKNAVTVINKLKNQRQTPDGIAAMEKLDFVMLTPDGSVVIWTMCCETVKVLKALLDVEAGAR